MNARQVISDIMEKDVPEAGPATALGQLPGWDSMKVVRLVIRLEDAVGRELSEAEIETLQTVADVERLLRR